MRTSIVTVFVFALVFVLGLTLVACSDSTPSVSALASGFTPTPVIKTQSSEFAEAHSAGAKYLQTADQYSAKIKIHSGQALNQLKTSDQYRMTVRGVSF